MVRGLAPRAPGCKAGRRAGRGGRKAVPSSTSRAVPCVFKALKAHSSSCLFKTLLHHRACFCRVCCSWDIRRAHNAMPRR